MKQKELEYIKRTGAVKELKDRVSSILCEIKTAAEKAWQNNYRDFDKQIKDIRLMADNAIYLMEEARKEVEKL